MQPSSSRLCFGPFENNIEDIGRDGPEQTFNRKTAWNTAFMTVENIDAGIWQAKA